MIGDHIAGEPDAAVPGPRAEILERLLASEITCDFVIIDRVGGGDRLRISHHLFDSLGCPAPLPDADKPEGIDIPLGELVKFLVGDLIECGNRS